MRTLVISREAPFPPRSGAPLRTWQNIRLLATRGPVTVLSFGDSVDGRSTLPGVERWLHIEDSEYPFRIFGGIARARKLVQPLQFPPDNEAVTDELNQRLRKFLAETTPDTIVLSNWMRALPDALRGFPRIIVDAHNIESFLYEDVMRAVHPRPSLAMQLQFARYRRRERRLLRSAARVWVSSSDDALALSRLDPKLPPPTVWPNVMDVDAFSQVRSGEISPPVELGPDRPTVIYVGHYPYPPNARAALRLIERVFPLVAGHLPDARLLLVGQGPSPEMRAAADRDPRIVVTGGVADTRPYLRAAGVCAVPLAEGGGTRLKILEAFASRVPVVSTSKGAEGIAADPDRHLLIAEDDRGIAAAIVDVLRRPEHYRAQTADALALVEERYSMRTLAKLLDHALPPSDTPELPLESPFQQAVSLR
jgi:glycosyltransferase involved in cell wall biosynthesis